MTRALSFEDLFAVHAADKEELEGRSFAVQMEKEHQARMAESAEGRAPEDVSVPELEADNIAMEKERISLEKEESSGDQIPGNANLPEDSAGDGKSEDSAPKPGKTITEQTSDEGSRSTGTQSEVVAEKTAVDLFAKNEEEAVEDKAAPSETPDSVTTGTGKETETEDKTPIDADEEPIPVDDEDLPQGEDVSVQENESIEQESGAMEEVSPSQEEPAAPKIVSSETEFTEETSEAATDDRSTETKPTQRQQPPVQKATPYPMSRRTYRPSGVHENPYREEKPTETVSPQSASSQRDSCNFRRMATLSSLLDRHKQPVTEGRNF